MKLLGLLGWCVVAAPAAAGAVLGVAVAIHGLATGHSADATKPGGEAWKIMWMLDSLWIAFAAVLAGALESGAILLILTAFLGFELPGM